MSGASYGASSGASSGACLGIVWAMSGASSGACLGQSKISKVLHASLMLFLIVTEIHNIHEFSEGVKMHLC